MGIMEKIREMVNDMQGKPNFTEAELKELRDIKRKALLKEARARAEREGIELARRDN